MHYFDSCRHQVRKLQSWLLALTGPCRGHDLYTPVPSGLFDLTFDWYFLQLEYQMSPKGHAIKAQFPASVLLGSGGPFSMWGLAGRSYRKPCPWAGYWDLCLSFSLSASEVKRLWGEWASSTTANFQSCYRPKAQAWVITDWSLQNCEPKETCLQVEQLRYLLQHQKAEWQMVPLSHIFRITGNLLKFFLE